MRHLALLAAAVAAALPAQRVPDLRVDRGTPPGASESWRPDVAVVGTNVYVTWMDYRDGGMDIRFNRSTDGGRTWLSSDPRLDVGSAPGAAWSADPRIAVDGSNVVVVWQDFRNGPFPHDAGIYANRSTDGGITWLPVDVRVDSGGVPGVVALNHEVRAVGGTVFVTWEDQRDGSRDVYFDRSLDGGATWSPTDARLDVGDAPGSANSIFPQLAVSNTDVHVVWADFRNNQFTADIYYNRSLDSGTTWLPAAARIDSSTTITFGGSSSPRIAASGSSVYVLYNDNRNDPGLTPVSRDVYFNRSLDRGATWLPADVRLNTSGPAGTFFTEFPDLCAAGNAVFAVWTDRRSPRTVAFNRSLDGGATWLLTDVAISDPQVPFANVDVPRIACSGPLLLATWADNRAGEFDVFYNTSNDQGSTWMSSDRRLDTGDDAGAHDSFLPVPAFGSTVPYVVWQDERDGEEDIYVNLPYGYLPFGAGKPGAAGAVPRMRAQGLATIGSSIDYRLDNGLGGALGLIALGLQRQSSPVLGGTLLVVPVAHLWFVLSGPTGVPGAGSIAIPTSFPNDPALRGLGIFGQGFVFDAGSTFGLSMSDGIEIWIG